MKYRLYIDGNTVYGIDEECMKKRQASQPQKNPEEIQREEENYLLILMCMIFWNIVPEL